MHQNSAEVSFWHLHPCLFIGQCCYVPLGVVEYLSREDMKTAVRQLDDTRLGGKYIRVREVRQTLERKAR